MNYRRTQPEWMELWVELPIATIVVTAIMLFVMGPVVLTLMPVMLLLKVLDND